MTHLICTSKYLKRCKLWEGSHEYLDFKYGQGISLENLKTRLIEFNTYIDLTESELEYVNAIQKTIDDPLGLEIES